MSEPKDHHFAPIFYLKGWCGADGKVEQYTRPYRDVVCDRKTPDSTGFQKFLYSFTGGTDEGRHDIEKKYMSERVDNDAAIALQMLLDRNPEKFGVKERSDWTRFMMAAMHRRPAAVAEIQCVFGTQFEKNLETDKDSNTTNPATGLTPLQELRDRNPHFVKDAGLTAMVDSIENAEVGDMIINMKWNVFDVDGGSHDLLTGDAPLIRTSGLKDENCLLIMPLSHRLYFCAAHSKDVANGFMYQDKTSVASLINDLIAKRADQYVFGKDDRQKRFVANRLGRYEDLKRIII